MPPLTRTPPELYGDDSLASNIMRFLKTYKSPYETGPGSSGPDMPDFSDVQGGASSTATPDVSVTARMPQAPLPPQQVADLPVPSPISAPPEYSGVGGGMAGAARGAFLPGVSPRSSSSPSSPVALTEAPARALRLPGGKILLTNRSEYGAGNDEGNNARVFGMGSHYGKVIRSLDLAAQEDADRAKVTDIGAASPETPMRPGSEATYGPSPISAMQSLVRASAQMARQRGEKAAGAMGPEQPPEARLAAAAAEDMGGGGSVSMPVFDKDIMTEEKIRSLQAPTALAEAQGGLLHARELGGMTVGQQAALGSQGVLTMREMMKLAGPMLNDADRKYQQEVAAAKLIPDPVEQRRALGAAEDHDKARRDTIVAMAHAQVASGYYR